MAKDIFTWAAMIAGFGAAALWFIASSLIVPYNPNNHSGSISASSSGTSPLVDIVATARRQCRWNKWAAALTGFAASCQAITQALSAAGS